MPTYDLRNIKVAKYHNNNGTVTHEGATECGDAMNVNLELRFAEGRLYAEGGLAELMRKCTGGTISIGVKYIKNPAQIMMFGNAEKTRSIKYTPTGGTEKTVQVKGLTLGKKSKSGYVSVAFFAPDLIDGEEKVTCVYISRALFGAPAKVYQTAGEQITFQTDTTTGEFLNDHSADGNLIEIAVVDDEEAAAAWVNEVLK